MKILIFWTCRHWLDETQNFWSPENDIEMTAQPRNLSAIIEMGIKLLSRTLPFSHAEQYRYLRWNEQTRLPFTQFLTWLNRHAISRLLVE